jgi:hypothetical protein
VDKTDEVRAIFARFVELHRNPEQVMGRSVAAALAAVVEASPVPRSPQDAVDAPSATNAEAPEALGAQGLPAQPLPSAADAAEAASANASASASASATAPAKTGEESPWWYADLKKHGGSSASSGQPARPPWPAPVFSASVRMLLRDRQGAPGGTLSELYAGIWSPHLSTSSDPPAVANFQACNDILANSPSNVLPDRDADWLAANVLLHYNRLARRPLPSAEAAGSAPGKEASRGDDLLRPEYRQAGSVLNKAMKVFAHAEHRERREHTRHRFRPTPKVPLPPDVPPEGDMLETKPAPTMGNPITPGAGEKNAPVAEEPEPERPADAGANSASRAL